MLWRPVSSERQSEARAAQGYCSKQDKPWTGGRARVTPSCSDRRPVLLGSRSPSEMRDTGLTYSFHSGLSWRTPQ